MALKPRTRKPSRQDGPPDDPVAASADPALLAAAQRARKMLHRRALTAAAASVVPVPGLDWAVDAALLSRLLPRINTRTLCPLGDAAAMPVGALLQRFRSEFEAHVRTGACPLPTRILG